MAKKRLTKSDWQQIRTAYVSGIGLRELARNMGIPEGTVLARAKREGWTDQIQSAKALIIRPDTSPAVTPAEAVAVTMRERGERHVTRMADTVEKIMKQIENLAGDELLDLIERIEKFDKVARRTYGLDEQENGPLFAIQIALQ